MFVRTRNVWFTVEPAHAPRHAHFHPLDSLIAGQGGFKPELDVPGKRQLLVKEIRLLP